MEVDVGGFKEVANNKTVHPLFSCTPHAFHIDFVSTEPRVMNRLS